MAVEIRRALKLRWRQALPDRSPFALSTLRFAARLQIGEPHPGITLRFRDGNAPRDRTHWTLLRSWLLQSVATLVFAQKGAPPWNSMARKPPPDRDIAIPGYSVPIPIECRGAFGRMGCGCFNQFGNGK